jgi:hypothetical protein
MKSLSMLHEAVIKLVTYALFGTSLCKFCCGQCFVCSVMVSIL